MPRHWRHRHDQVGHRGDAWEGARVLILVTALCFGLAVLASFPLLGI